MYAHVKDHGQPTTPRSGDKSKKPCKFFQLGTCRFGDGCEHLHVNDDRPRGASPKGKPPKGKGKGKGKPAAAAVAVLVPKHGNSEARVMSASVGSHVVQNIFEARVMSA